MERRPVAKPAIASVAIDYGWASFRRLAMSPSLLKIQEPQPQFRRLAWLWPQFFRK
jgi:hypothetical protein